MDEIWFEKAAEIDAIFKSVPHMPNPIEGETYAVTCAKSRIREIIAVIDELDWSFSYVGIFTDQRTFSLLEELTEYMGIEIATQVIYKDDSCGTFTVNIDSDSNVWTLTRPPLGIIYEAPVSLSLWETRWIFQEIDGMDPKTALQSAKALCE